ncbi:MAG: allantoate deiminase [Solirubrobacteraceae bacterium]|nr:allantoate deiminase [Solirubrobacteraceae bacterium]
MIVAVTDARAVLERCDELARCSEEPGRLTRRFGTPALAEARSLVAGWMEAAGLTPRVDAVGNLLGRRGSGPVFLLGSHLDTVVDAGRYDGPLGVLCAIAVAERLPDRRLEVAAFADEEGVRFGTAYLGSALLAGRFDPAWLDRTDAGGVALRSLVGDPASLAGPPRDDLLGYAEVHIEQGPVLERLDRPVGVVTAIAGQTRARVTFTGRAAHAGTTPMDRRSDALVAAAGWVLEVHALARATPGLVATVGELRVEPGAGNVVPGRVVASLDVRHPEDEVRAHAVAQLLAGVEAEVLQDNDAIRCDDAGFPAALPRLASGAGHDAVMLSAVCPVSMLFVRSPGGISHHPAEAVREADVAVALDALTGFVEGRC